MQSLLPRENVSGLAPRFYVLFRTCDSNRSITWKQYRTIINTRGGSICNENSFIAPSTNALGFYAIYQTKDQSVAGMMVHEALFIFPN